MTSRFPHSEPFVIDGLEFSADEIVTTLSEMMTERRRARIEEVLDGRTYDLCTVLDGLYDRGNVSAVVRSAEAMGIAPMHIIETQDDFKAANRVTQGADKWLDIRRWDDPAACCDHLHDLGYRIVATELEASRPIDELDFTVPTALVFGNERDGVSDAVLDAADARIVIPMRGFSQSFNISVAAAMTFYHAVSDRLRRRGRHGDLTDDERRLLRAAYYLRACENAARVLTLEP